MINDDDAFAATLRDYFLRRVYGHYEPVRRVQRTELTTGGPREPPCQPPRVAHAFQTACLRASPAARTPALRW